MVVCPIVTLMLINNVPSISIGVIFRLFLTKYNYLHPPDVAGFCHGGHNSQSSHIFYYKKYIHFFRGLTLRHMDITTKNIQKLISYIDGIIHPNTTKYKLIKISRLPKLNIIQSLLQTLNPNFSFDVLVNYYCVPNK